MKYKRKVMLFVLLAGVCSVTTGYTAAIPSIMHVFIVLPLVCMGISLFFAGYYAGLYRSRK